MQLRPVGRSFYYIPQTVDNFHGLGIETSDGKQYNESRRERDAGRKVRVCYLRAVVSGRRYMKKRVFLLLITVVISLFTLILLSSCNNSSRLFGGKIVENTTDFFDPMQSKPKRKYVQEPIIEVGDWKIQKVHLTDDISNQAIVYRAVEYTCPGENMVIPMQYEGIPIAYFNAETVINASTFIRNVYYEGDISSWCNIIFNDYYPLKGERNLYINNELVTELTIPDGVEKICPNAFYAWKGTKVVVPGSVKRIYDNAFCNCEKLTSVTLNEGLRTIGSHCFYNCVKLAEINIPQSVTAIGSSAFEKCGKIKNIALTGKIRKIEDRTFSNCASLENIVLPATLKTIGEGAFYKCASIDNIVVPGEVIKIGPKVFFRCTKLETATIGSKVDFIGGDAFADCEILKSITFADTKDWYSANYKEEPKQNDRSTCGGKSADVSDPANNASEMKKQNNKCWYRFSNR